MDLLPNVFEGNFIRQLQMNEFVFVSGKGTFSVEFIDTTIHFPPVLNCVVYYVQLFNQTQVKILHAKKSPWSKLLHFQFFIPATLFVKDFSLQAYKHGVVKDMNYYNWLNFDEDFKAETLIPHLELSQYRSLVDLGQFTKLVREFGGVNPTALAQYVGRDHDLVKEAMILYEITQCMKRYKRVWLSEEEVGMFLYESHLLVALRRLIELDVIRFHDNQIGITWAIKQLEAGQVLIQEGKLNIVFAKGFIPGKALDSKSMKPRGVDPRYPVDRFVDRCILATSFFVQLNSEQATTVHNQCTVSKYSSRVECQAALELTLNFRMPIVFVSLLGNFKLNFNQKCSSTVVFKTDTVRPFKIGDVAKVNFNLDTDYSNVTCTAEPNQPCKLKTSIVAANSIIISRLRFEKLDVLNWEKNYGTIIVQWNESVPEHWMYRLTKMATKSKVIFVNIKN